MHTISLCSCLIVFTFFYWLAQVMQHIPNVLTSLGPRGILALGEFRLHRKAAMPDSFVLFKPPAVLKEEIVDVTGAGDSFVAGFCAAWVEGLLSYPKCVVAGLQAAALSLKSKHPISTQLSRKAIFS